MKKHLYFTSILLIFTFTACTEDDSSSIISPVTYVEQNIVKDTTAKVDIRETIPEKTVEKIDLKKELKKQNETKKEVKKEIKGVISPTQRSIDNLKKNLKSKVKPNNKVSREYLTELKTREKGVLKYIKAGKDIYCMTVEKANFGFKYNEGLSNNIVKISNYKNQLLHDKKENIYIIDKDTNKTYHILNCYKKESYKYKYYLQRRGVEIPNNIYSE